MHRIEIQIIKNIIMEIEILREVKDLGESLQDSNVYLTLIRQIEKLNEPFIRIGILGGANVGKSSLINMLLIDSITLPVSSVSSVNDIKIYPNDDNYYRVEGKKVIINKSDKLIFNDEKTVEIYLKNKWLAENKLSLSEYHDIAITGDSTDQDIAACLYDVNICIYMLDALMPLTKQDAWVLAALDKFEIPTILIVAKFEKLMEEEQKDVSQYLDDKLSKYSSIKYAGNESLKPLSGISTEVKDFIESAVKSVDFSKQKKGYENLFLGDAVSKLRFLCQSKLEENEKNKQKVSDTTQKKYDKIKALETEWMRIEVALSEQRQKTEHRIREKLDSMENDMLKRLRHNIDVSNDIKQYWEKELSCHLNDMMRSETQTLLQIINDDIVNNLKWLQEEVIKMFEFQTPMIPFVSVISDDKEITLEDLQLADNKRLKMITRVGTAAAVVCAGVLVVVTNIGGIAMTIVVLLGIGAEFFMNRKTKESRQKVLDVLPNILEKAKLEYVAKVLVSLKSSYDEILANFKLLHQEWKDKAIKEIKEEALIASHNLITTQWDDCMNRINKLLNK
jgi:GTPase Era involved in 16S rRNA processing